MDAKPTASWLAGPCTFTFYLLCFGVLPGDGVVGGVPLVHAGDVPLDDAQDGLEPVDVEEPQRAEAGVGGVPGVDDRPFPVLPGHRARQLEEGAANHDEGEEDHAREEESRREENEHVRPGALPLHVVGQLGQVQQRIALVENEEGHHSYYLRETRGVGPDDEGQRHDMVELHHEGIEPPHAEKALHNQAQIPPHFDQVVALDFVRHVLRAEAGVALGRVKHVAPIKGRAGRYQVAAEEAQRRAADHEPNLLLQLIDGGLKPSLLPVVLEFLLGEAIHARAREDEGQGDPRAVLQPPQPGYVEQRHRVRLQKKKNPRAQT
eukprot:CAMPEP_0197491858 /NCGR_PEP_ID=MMETSP1311-20131121/5988_1 /TAXON_ID=464262 /ORGANISM="Genus nov. species nov., Strain RCC856" /LENGTH=319 /DNA_ID=CAMNT_0043036569 /DNA_START=48 /DNA_END=1003 /DNA_ORIENTATION=+